jgi:opacity protein-like surface antigen
MRTTTAAAMLLASVSAPALAQEDGQALGKSGYDTAPAGGLYLELRGTLSFLGDQDLGRDVSGEATFDPGFGGGASVGYHVLDNLRVEAEGVAEVNDIDEASPVTADGIQQAPANSDPAGLGDIVAVGGFANVIYDVTTGTGFNPYLGGGLGLLRLDAEYGAFAAEDSDVLAAFQARTGVTWQVTRQTGMTLGYRYRSTFGDPTFDAPAGKVEAEYGSHALEIGLRYRF